MGRFASSIVAVVLAAVVTLLGGYWNSRGVVPVGDARVPAQAIGVLIVLCAGGAGLAFGHLIPWESIVSAMKRKPSAIAPGVPSLKVINELDRVAEIPVRVSHLLGCVHHLRVALRGDDEGQELLDKIAVKVGRVGAELQKVQPGGA